jgi:hypothetical protein
MKSHACSRLAIRIAVILFGLTTYALAGPPLICHPFEIGQAKSLPWIDWNQQGSGGYDLSHLTGDTLAILASNRNVLVQMETLRRAGIYARQDPQVARELLTRLHARAASADAAGHSDALAWFDVGYLAETYKQWIGKGEPNPASGLGGYGWVKKAISLRGQDPEMEFAAALITLTGSKDDYREHARKALEGAKTDPLLAQNVASHLDRRTVSEVFTDKSAG